MPSPPRTAPVVALLGVACLLAARPAAAGRHLVLHGTAGASVQSWDATLVAPSVPIETESLRALHLASRLSWRGRTLLSLSHDRTLDGSRRQADLLAAGGERASALEQTLGALDLLAWVAGTERGRGGELSFLARLLGLKVSYAHSLHFGRTAAVDDFVYVPFGGRDAPLLFEDREQLRFRTLFRDLRVETPIWFDRVYPGAVIRVGYFHSRWEKVAEVEDVLLDGDPVVQDSRRDAGGLTLAYEMDLDRPGFGWALAVDWGFVGDGLTGPLHRDEGEDEPSTRYAALRGELRLNLRRGRGTGPSLSLGAAFEARKWTLDGHDLDRDLRTRLYGRVGLDLAF